jgi:hypothetical protein
VRGMKPWKDGERIEQDPSSEGLPDAQQACKA